MRKLVLKLPLANLTAIAEPLAQSGRRLGPATVEFDRIFVPSNWQQVYGTIAKTPKLLIRSLSSAKQQDHLLILKRALAQQTILLFQTPILNYDQMAHIINQIGYEFYGEVKKTRRQLLAGSLSIKVDQIDEAWYLKIEKILEAEQLGDEQELLEIAHSLGQNQAPINKEYIEILKENDNVRG